MRSGRMARRLVATAGMGAILAMGVLTACASKEAPAPETVTKTVTETAAPPTEKSINPTGGNLFTPPVQATPAPNVPPGQHPGIGGTP
jgi:hypothetical protein